MLSFIPYLKSAKARYPCLLFHPSYFPLKMSCRPSLGFAHLFTAQPSDLLWGLFIHCSTLRFTPHNFSLLNYWICPLYFFTVQLYYLLWSPTVPLLTLVVFQELEFTGVMRFYYQAQDLGSGQKVGRTRLLADLVFSLRILYVYSVH